MSYLRLKMVDLTWKPYVLWAPYNPVVAGALKPKSSSSLCAGRILTPKRPIVTMSYWPGLVAM